MFQYNFISKRDIKKYVIKSLKVIAIDKLLYRTSASVYKTYSDRILRIRKAVKYRAIV